MEARTKVRTHSHDGQEPARGQAKMTSIPILWVSVKGLTLNLKFSNLKTMETMTTHMDPRVLIQRLLNSQNLTISAQSFGVLSRLQSSWIKTKISHENEKHQSNTKGTH